MEQKLTDRLKAGTREQHEAVERGVDLDALAGSREAYLAHLCALWGVHAPLEARLARLDWAQVGVDFESRRRVELLRADIEALAAEVDVEALPTCERLAPVETICPLETIWQGLGCLYVLEGSRLGGQMIARALEERLGLRPERACRFLSSHGVRLGQSWKAFKSAVDCAGAEHPEHAATVVASANATFASVQRWFEAGGHRAPREVAAGEDNP
ncbi:MAG: biliverdin-producing heme oxygenase [Persicimonas sp.]